MFDEEVTISDHRLRFPWTALLWRAAIKIGCPSWRGTLYFEEIGKQTVDAAKEHDKVVLSHATYKQEPRDVVIETIVKGGVPREHITIIELTIDKAVKFRYLYHRTKRQVELQGGITLEEVCMKEAYSNNGCSLDGRWRKGWCDVNK